MPFSREVAWKFLDRAEVEEYVSGYREFMAAAKTEREVVEELVRRAEAAGFERLGGGPLGPGDRVYDVFKGKTAAFAVVGSRPLSEGISLVAAHGDSPRLDLKPLPVTEDKDARLGLLQTGWYGGVVRYHWVGVPLEVRGVVVTREGRAVRVRSPTFVIPDLLPHLSRKRFEERKGNRVVQGEDLKIPAANVPAEGEGVKEPFREAVLRWLRDEYGVEEGDLVSAELEVVPALDPTDVGVDGSMVAAYGQDDRVCVYAGFTALLSLESPPPRTSVFLVVDKEEIGSESNTSAQSLFFRGFLEGLAAALGEPGSVDRCLLRSRAISADVNAAINPAHKGVYDAENAAALGCGVVVTRTISVAGKYRAAEANAEYLAWLRSVLDGAGVPWQPGTLVSRADETLGGGGTIGAYLARMGMDVVDVGPALLGMHSTYELASKADVYSSYLAYRAFFGAE